MYCELTEGCENFKEGNMPGCPSCNHAARKASKVKVKVVTPVKKMTQKKADELAKYPGLKRQYIAVHPICEVVLTGCTFNSIQIHHCSISAKNFLNTDTWLAVCPNCHKFVEDMPAEKRRELGWLTD
jgi:hypothetical protein